MSSQSQPELSAPAHAPSFREALLAWRDRRVAAVLLFGVSSGLPWLLFGSAMARWLQDAGLSRSAIGVFGSVTAIYTFNFLVAPLVDRYRIPLTDRLGHRRGWVLAMQCALAVLTLTLTQVNPVDNLGLVALIAIAIAAAGAVMDIAIDAYRIDVIPREEQAAISHAAAAATAGWWTGYSLVGALAFVIVGQTALDWQQVYAPLAVVWLLLMAITVFAPAAPDRPRPARSASFGALMADIGRSYWAPLAEFFTRNGPKLAGAILAFIITFKLGEAFLGRMSVVFYNEVGYSDTEIGVFSKAYGWLITIVFSLLASVFNARFGLIRGLIIGGVAMASTNLLFCVIALLGPENWLFVVTVTLDNFTAAYSTVAFVAFVSFLTSHAFSATQYAMMASLGNSGRALLAAPSGVVIDAMGGNWALFFLLTSLMVVPGLLLLLWVARMLRERFGEQAVLSGTPAATRTPSNGGMSMRRLCRLAELADPGSARFELPEHPYGYSLALIHRDGEVHGYLNSCPHTDAPMDWTPGQFLTAAADYIQCSLHGALFAVDSGECVQGPCKGDALTPVELEVRDGLVYLAEDFEL